MSILIYKQRHRHPNYKKTPKGNYAHIGYIATRPGAVKNEGMRHGLFGKLEPGAVKEFDTWQEAARLVRELSYRRVNMYRGIISFSPETAAELGLSDHKAWEDYIDRHILTLAKFNGIRVQDLQWVAAHHNEKGHPHIHVVFWNKHQRTMVPFVHPSIPDKIRKQLIRDTFAERIKEYCEAKQRAKEHLSAITDEMIDEFEKYIPNRHSSLRTWRNPTVCTWRLCTVEPVRTPKSSWQLRISSLWSRRKIPQLRMANRVRYPMITMRPTTPVIMRPAMKPQRNRRLRIPMANKQKQMLAVWGSPGGGKTVTAVKLALELSKRKKNVVLVFTDVTAPTLPAVVSEKKLPDVSVGELLAAPGMTQEQVLKTCVPCEKNPYISFLGYKAGENVFTHAEYSKEKAVDMLVLLRHIADYVIVDCTSLLTGNVLATTALEVADDVLRVCSCDLKAISYFSSYLSLVADRKFKPEQHIKVLSNTRPYQGGSEYENSFGGVKYRLPYLPSLEEQAATLKLLEPLSGKEAKTYEPVIAAIAGEVFGDGK